MPLRPDHGSTAAEIQAQSGQMAPGEAPESGSEHPLTAIGPSPEFAPIAAPALPIPPVRPDPEPDYRVESDTDFGVLEYGPVQIELPVLDAQSEAVAPADQRAADQRATFEPGTFEPAADQRVTFEPATFEPAIDESWTDERGTYN